MRKNISLLLFICAAFLASCTPRTYEEISEDISKDNSQEATTTVTTATTTTATTTTATATATTTKATTYTANIQAVIKTNCISCHSIGRQFPALETYEQVKDATQNGDLICRIDQTQACGSVMPRSGAMPRQTIDMIILWQKEGYKN